MVCSWRQSWAQGYFNIGLALHHQARPDAAIRAYSLALLYSNGDALVRESALRIWPKICCWLVCTMRVGTAMKTA